MTNEYLQRIVDEQPPAQTDRADMSDHVRSLYAALLNYTLLRLFGWRNLLLHLGGRRADDRVSVDLQ